MSRARLFCLIGEEPPLTIVPAMSHSENDDADNRKRRNGNRGHRDNEALHAVIGLRQPVALLHLIVGCSLFALGRTRFGFRCGRIGFATQRLCKAQGITLGLFLVICGIGFILHAIIRLNIASALFFPRRPTLGCSVKGTIGLLRALRSTGIIRGRLVRTRNVISGAIQSAAQNRERGNERRRIHDRSARRSRTARRGNGAGRCARSRYRIRIRTRSRTGAVASARDAPSNAPVSNRRRGRSA